MAVRISSKNQYHNNESALCIWNNSKQALSIRINQAFFPFVMPMLLFTPLFFF